MQRALALVCKRRQERFAQRVVAEGVALARAGQHVLARQRFDHRIGLGDLLRLGDLEAQRQRHAPAVHGQRFGQAALGLGQARDARGLQRMHAARQLAFMQRKRQHPGALDVAHAAIAHQLLGQLHARARVAAGHAVQQRGEPLAVLGTAEPGAHERAHVRAAERAQVQACVPPCSAARSAGAAAVSCSGSRLSTSSSRFASASLASAASSAAEASSRRCALSTAIKTARPWHKRAEPVAERRQHTLPQLARVEAEVGRVRRGHERCLAAPEKSAPRSLHGRSAPRALDRAR